ncbi:MAG: methyltransferase domain-containing protein [Legionellales bacterium]|nr:methyltransferase domain-containing protein [Legionellales bacterium]
MSNFWHATTYSQFIDLRTRPAIDLLAILPQTLQPQIIYDLGCGPGNSTILLKNRWPEAKVTGIDSSPNMLEKAHKDYPNLHFIEADIEHFTVNEKIDLICANASLQWVDNHQQLFPRLISFLSESGALAIQMPNNFHAPSHQITLNILKNNIRWQPLIKQLRYGVLTQPFYDAKNYYDLLTEAGLDNLHIWETEYFQEMADYHAIFDWVKGTGLRPVLSMMDQSQQSIFTEVYLDQLSHEYPLQKNGKILLPFRRLFMVGFKPQ